MGVPGAAVPWRGRRWCSGFTEKKKGSRRDGGAREEEGRVRVFGLERG
jgi:hypothetical protein